MVVNKTSLLAALPVFALNLGLALTPSVSQAFQLGQPTYGGSGCPGGTAQVIVDRAGTGVSVSFDQFVAEVGTRSGRTMDRKACAIAIPVSVPSGYSVGLSSPDLSTFAHLSRGVTATINTEAFLAGSDGRKVERKLTGPLTEDVLVEGAASGVEWTGCGQDAILRVNTSVLLRAEQPTKKSFLIVEHFEHNESPELKLYVRRCK